MVMAMQKLWWSWRCQVSVWGDVSRCPWVCGSHLTSVHSHPHIHGWRAEEQQPLEEVGAELLHEMLELERTHGVIWG